MASEAFCITSELGIPCFDPDPASVTCPYCQNRDTTTVVFSMIPLITMEHHLTFCILCLLCCWCCVPCVYYDTEKNFQYEHTCPNCHKQLGVYVTMERDTSYLAVRVFKNTTLNKLGKRSDDIEL